MDKIRYLLRTEQTEVAAAMARLVVKPSVRLITRIMPTQELRHSCSKQDAYTPTQYFTQALQIRKTCVPTIKQYTPV